MTEYDFNKLIAKLTLTSFTSSYLPVPHTYTTKRLVHANRFRIFIFYNAFTICVAKSCFKVTARKK